MAGPKPAALPLGDGPLIRLNRNLRITGVHIVTHSSQPFVNPPGESTDGRSAGENPQAGHFSLTENITAQSVTAHEVGLHPENTLTAR